MTVVAEDKVTKSWLYGATLARLTNIETRQKPKKHIQKNNKKEVITSFLL